MSLAPDKAALFRELSPLIADYLASIHSPASVEGYVRELEISPIRLEETLVGFWALRIRQLGKTKLATVKGFYIAPEFRGKYRNAAADLLIEGFARQGITDLEIWADENVQRWLTERYGLKPRLFVSHAPLEVFDIKRKQSAS